ncbi:hypothetical protein, partial [Diaphorobacter sp.]|uniref:hypothetical protein n=1 Tax=Diaphorobacter sp. TaxID=1934310 RepID=UPI00258D0984
FSKPQRPADRPAPPRIHSWPTPQRSIGIDPPPSKNGVPMKKALHPKMQGLYGFHSTSWQSQLSIGN